MRLRAPDGGLDTLLPSGQRPGKGERGWQAKHYGRDLHWNKCQESLDRAVRVWGVCHVTFVFPRDLNQSEHQTFHDKLGKRHAGVAVDYWGAGAVSSRLLADDRGERIARRFFGVIDPIGAIERAHRAGGELSRAEHLLDREAAIHEYLEGADPHFSWVVQRLTRDEAPLSPRPDVIMRLFFSRGDQVLVADAIPRSRTSATQYGPKVRLIADASPEGEEVRRLLRELFRGGGRVRLREGVKIDFDRIPRPFQDMVQGPIEGEVLITSVHSPEPFYATIEASGDLGETRLDLDLMPIEQPEEWDLALRGSRGGFQLTVLTRWSVNEGVGVTKYGIEYRSNFRAPLIDQAAAARLMVALHGDGHLRIRDRAGHRSLFERPLQRRPLDPDIADLTRLLSALLEIEHASGFPAPTIPNDIPRADIDHLEAAARTVREGGRVRRLTSTTLRGSSKTVEHFRHTGSDIVLRATATVTALGREIPYAEFVTRLPLMKVSHAERLPGAEDDWEITLVPLAAEEIEVFVEYRPLRVAGDAA